MTGALATLEQQFAQVVERIWQTEEGKARIRELAMATGAFAPSEQYWVRHGSELLDRTIEPALKSCKWLELVLAFAIEQINIETTKDSPWYIRERDDKKTRARKTLERENAIAYRAGEILMNLEPTIQLAQVDLIRVFRKKRLELFPADGTYTDLYGVFKSMSPDTPTSGSQRQVIKFVEEQMDLFEQAGVPAVEVARAAQKHEGLYILGRMSAAANRVMEEGELTAEEKKEGLQQIVKNAQTAESISAFEKTYQTPRIPPIPYQVMYGEDVHLIIMRATEEQLDSFERRNEGKIERTAEELFQPIRPGMVYSALLEAESLDPPPEALIQRLRGVVRALVLADRACAVAMGILEAHMIEETGKPKWVEWSTIDSVTPSFPPQMIEQALADLLHFRLAEYQEVTNKRMWRVRRDDRLG